jgi:uncharacterized protein (DUF362 family)
MSKPKKVSLVSGEDRKENIKKCLTLIRDDLEPIKNAKNILIKPNLVAIKPDFANTHVEAIEAVIEFIREMVPETPITVGESSASAFYMGKPIDSPIHSVVGDTHLRITKRVEGFDYKISLSIPKTHNFAIATLGIKNMAGLVLRKDMAMIHGMKGGIEVDAPKTLLDKLPSGTVSRARRALPNWLINFLFRQYPTYRKSVKMIHRNIVEIAKRTWPDLVVLDGFICMEGDGPVDGTSVVMKTAIASVDPLKADGAGARLIGFEPEDIGYLYYLQNEEHMGDYSLEGFIGDNLNQIRRRFRRHGTYDIQSQWHEEDKLKIKM